MKQKGVLAVVSGFSGAGKGTVLKGLLDKYDNYAFSISATTRDPRPGEENGREYFFVKEDRFEEMIRKDQLIEYARYVNHYYGTPRDYVETRLAEGTDVILEIEIQGALNVKKKYPDAILIFVLPPTAKELEHRLTGRGTETAEVIRQRLSRAYEEADGMEMYDYILVNDSVDLCVEELHRLIQSQHLRTKSRMELVSKMKDELKELVENM